MSESSRLSEEDGSTRKTVALGKRVARLDRHLRELLTSLRVLRSSSSEDEKLLPEPEEAELELNVLKSSVQKYEEEVDDIRRVYTDAVRLFELRNDNDDFKNADIKERERLHRALQKVELLIDKFRMEEIQLLQSK